MYAVPGVVLTWWASGAWVHGCLEERVKDFSSSKIHHECHEHDKHHRYMARKLRQFNCITRCAYHILVAGDGILPFKPPTKFMLGNKIMTDSPTRGSLASWINRGTTGATGLALPSPSASTCDSVKRHGLVKDMPSHDVGCRYTLVTLVNAVAVERHRLEHPRVCKTNPPDSEFRGRLRGRR